MPIAESETKDKCYNCKFLSLQCICFIIIDRVIKKLWTGSDNQENQDSEKYDIKYDHSI